MTESSHSFDYDVLSRMIKENAPVGASSLALILNTSQATIGRKLLQLEHRGFLKKQSNKERVVTAEGQKYFQELKNDTVRAQRVKELIEGSLVSSEKDLLDILTARRVIERETAYLAAKNISREEC